MSCTLMWRMSKMAERSITKLSRMIASNEAPRLAPNISMPPAPARRTAMVASSFERAVWPSSLAFSSLRGVASSVFS